MTVLREYFRRVDDYAPEKAPPMRALVAYPDRAELRIIDVAEPAAPTGHQVHLSILEVGICGTDRDIAAFEYGQPPPGSDYLILGHESVAEVINTGPEVTAIRTGDLVVLTVRRHCPDPHCRACTIGRQDFCTTGEFSERGIQQAHGYLTEIVIDDEHNVVPVPPQLTDVATLIEPLSIAAKAADQAHAVQQRLPWQSERGRILVLGAGPSSAPSTSSTRPSASLASPSAPPKPSPQRPTHPHRHPRTSGAPATLPLDRIMKNIVLNNQAIIGTVNAGRSAFAVAVQKLEQAMYLVPDSVRAIITNRVPLDAAPDALRQPHGVKDIVRIRPN